MEEMNGWAPDRTIDAVNNRAKTEEHTAERSREIVLMRELKCITDKAIALKKERDHARNCAAAFESEVARLKGLSVLRFAVEKLFQRAGR